MKRETNSGARTGFYWNLVWGLRYLSWKSMFHVEQLCMSIQTSDSPGMGVKCPHCGAEPGEFCFFDAHRYPGDSRPPERVHAHSVHRRRVREAEVYDDARSVTHNELESGKSKVLRACRVEILRPMEGGGFRVTASGRTGETDLLFKHVAASKDWLFAWDRAREACRALEVLEIRLWYWDAALRKWVHRDFPKNDRALREALEGGASHFVGESSE